MTRIPLHSAHADLPLVDYLCLLWPDRSRRAVLELFARGAVRKDDRPVSPRVQVGACTELTLHVELDTVERMFPSSAPAPESGDIAILHEDERLVVVSKRAGVPVVPDRAREQPSVLERLTTRELAARAHKPPEKFVRYRVVHRIDRWTSGVVLLARDPAVERRLAADFEARRVHKEYLAIVRGEMSPARVTVDCAVAPGRKGKMRATTKGAAKDALTTFDVIERLPGFTLVLARPRTGRQHQIRVHAWAAGYPLAVDPLYAVGPAAAGAAPPGIERLTLHAQRYALPDSWDEPRSFTCPPPADFSEALRRLRESSGSADSAGSESRDREK